MRNLQQTILILMAAAALFALGCRKDFLSVTDEPYYPGPMVLIETGAMGLVHDEAGAPISGATVRLGQTQTYTDDNGFFRLKGRVGARQPFVMVEKPGYFPSMASFSSRAGKMGRLKVTLRPKTLSAQINSATGGQAPVQGGGMIILPQDAIVDATGQPYSGPLNVYATYIDPTDANVATRIPGGFQGITADNQMEVLQSFGMVQALLETPAGAKLNLGKPAQLVIPVPPSLVARAPASIPLWSLDPQTSLWREESRADLQGGIYSGMVSHFSWWNVDISVPTVSLSGQVTANGAIAPFLRIRITTAQGWVIVLTTDDEGFFNTFVPEGQTIKIEIIDECQQVIYTADIGPLSDDTVLPPIALTTQGWSTISGALVQCDNQPVTNGLIFTYIAGAPAFPLPVDPGNGTFEAAIPICGNDIAILGFDLDNFQSSGLVSQPAAPVVNFGNVSVCDQPLEGIIYLDENGQTLYYIPVTSAEFGTDPFSGTPTCTVRAIDAQPPASSITYSYIFHLEFGKWRLAAVNLSFQGNPQTFVNVNAVNDANVLALGQNPGDPVSIELTEVYLGIGGVGVNTIYYNNCRVLIYSKVK